MHLVVVVAVAAVSLSPYYIVLCNYTEYRVFFTRVQGQSLYNYHNRNALFVQGRAKGGMSLFESCQYNYP